MDRIECQKYQVSTTDVVAVQPVEPRRRIGAYVDDRDLGPCPVPFEIDLNSQMVWVSVLLAGDLIRGFPTDKKRDQGGQLATIGSRSA